MNYIYQLTILSGKLNDFSVLLMVIYKVTSYSISKFKCANRCDKPSLTWVPSLKGWKQLASTLFSEALKSPAFPACPLGGLKALSLTQHASELTATFKPHLVKLPSQVIQLGIYKTGYNLLVTVKIEPERKVTWIY